MVTNCDCRMTQKQAVWACFEILFQHLSERKCGGGGGGGGENERKDIRDKLQTQLQNTEIFHGNK